MNLLETRGPHAFGRWTVTQVVEYEGEGMSCAQLFPGIPAGEVRKYSPAGASRRLSRDGRLVMSSQIFLIRSGDIVALVDLGAGDGTSRPAETPGNGLPRPYLETLDSLGAAPERVTHVFFTHLHADHVGLATTKKNAVRVPTFPRALHVIGKTEFDYWNDSAPGGGGRPPHFVDSVLPLAEAGLVRLAGPGDSIGGVRLHSAAGHSPGALLLELEGANVWFTGDLFHHPAQIARPDWPSGSSDWDQERNTRCRMQWLARFAETDAVLFTTHLGNALRVETTAEGGFFPKRGR